MNVLFDDLIFKIQTHGGVSSYWLGLLKNLPSKENYYILSSNEFTNHNIDLNKININILKRNIPLLFQRSIPLISRYGLDEPTVFHSSYYRINYSKKVFNVVTVHDFIAEKFFKKNKLSRLMKWFAINNADHLICISESTKKDLLHFFPHINENKITVIYHGSSDKFYQTKSTSHIEKFNIKDKPYILFVGQRHSYKNFNLCLKLISHHQKYNLLTVGGNQLDNNEMKLYNDFKNWHHLGFVSETELNELYNNAFCLFYPSSYEGFGMPLIDAMKVGCPVIVNSTSSLIEIGSSYAIIVDVFDKKDLYSSIYKIEDKRKDKNFKSSLISYAKNFTWVKSARLHQKVYQGFYQ